MLTLACLTGSWHLFQAISGYFAFIPFANFFPLTAAFFLFELILLGWLAVELCRAASSFHLGFRVPAAIIVFVLGCLVCFDVALLPSYLFGFSVRVRQMANPNDIALAAQRCLQLMPEGGSIAGPKKPLADDQDDKRWRQLSHFRFVHIGNDSVLIVVQPPQVRFAWGGALVGHVSVVYCGPEECDPLEVGSPALVWRHNIRFAQGH